MLPQTRSSFFHVVEEVLCLDGVKLFKNIQKYRWVVLPQTRPNSFHGVEKPFCLNVMQPVKNNHVYGWAALPNIPCHGRARLAALKHLFVLMFSRLSTTLKQTAGRAPPNTVQLISRCWNIFSSGWYEAFQIHSILWLGCAPPNTAQYFSRWTTFLSGCYAAK